MTTHDIIIITTHDVTMTTRHHDVTSEVEELEGFLERHQIRAVLVGAAELLHARLYLAQLSAAVVGVVAQSVAHACGVTMTTRD